MKKTVKVVAAIIENEDNELFPYLLHTQQNSS